MRIPPEPRARLSVVDGTAILVGVVVGVGIFGFPPLVAANVPSGAMYLGVWLMGGALMLVGALCYAELGSTWPSSGGEYHFLTRAYGQGVGLLFAWARGTVIQTGAIAAVAFIYGEYAQGLVYFGQHGTSLHAGLAVAALTGLNLAGTPQSKLLQKIFTAIALLAVVLVITAGLLAAGGSVPPSEIRPDPVDAGAGALGMALVYVLLTYGGWNEAAYLAGEMRDVRRDLRRVLLLGTAVVVLLYLFVNVAFLSIFGLSGLRESEAVGADLMERVAGPSGATLLSLLVCATSLSTMNGTILTGARVYHAVGRDVPRLATLGVWAPRGSTPTRALLVQGAITLGLIVFGALTAGSGVQAMVAYTSPVFWLFMLLVGASVWLLRRREPATDRPFRVPLYPITPLIFCLSSAGLLYSSVRYAGVGALVGLAVLLTGLPFAWVYRKS